MGPNIIQQENRMKAIPDAMLRQMLMQMTQTGQAGTPEFILAAGELQGRKEARQQAMMGQGNPRPVIADLLMGDAMPPQMPMLPENAGGVAALPAPNMEGVATMAGGGLVAFYNGGNPRDKKAELEQRTRDRERILREFEAAKAAGMDVATLIPRGLAGAFETSQVRPLRALGVNIPYFSDAVFGQGAVDSLTPYTDELRAKEELAKTAPVDRADAMKRFRRADNEGLAALAQTASPATQPAGAAPAATTPPAAGVGAAPAAGNQPTVPPTATPTAGVAPATVPTIDYKDAFEKAGATAKELLGTAPTMPAEVTTKSVKEAVEADRKLFEELGIADPTKLRRDQIEAEMKEAKSDKEQAGWMRLAEFGFNWASQNGPALQAAAKAGAAVAPGLISDLKELKKTERAQKRELAGLAALDAQAQRDMTAKARDRLDAKYESGLRRVDENRKNIATLSASIAANAITSQTQLTTTGMTTAASRDVAGMQAEALKIERDLARKDARARTALDAAEQSARDIMDPTERIAAIKRYFAAFYNTAYGEGAGTAAPPRASGKVVNGVYVPAGK